MRYIKMSQKILESKTFFKTLYILTCLDYYPDTLIKVQLIFAV